MHFSRWKAKKQKNIILPATLRLPLDLDSLSPPRRACRRAFPDRRGSTAPLTLPNRCPLAIVNLGRVRARVRAQGEGYLDAGDEHERQGQGEGYLDAGDEHERQDGSPPSCWVLGHDADQAPQRRHRCPANAHLTERTRTRPTREGPRTQVSNDPQPAGTHERHRRARARTGVMRSPNVLVMRRSCCTPTVHRTLSSKGRFGSPCSPAKGM
jgi:hypothetical protein